MSPRSCIIHVDNLTKKFGSTVALDSVQFGVSPGEVVGFVGPNGAGKTTTIASMLGFLRPTSGTIRLFGDTIRPQNAHEFHQRIGYASGDMALLESLTGGQFLRHMGHLTRVNPTFQKELIDQFEPSLDKPIKTLSRGNKQKIALIAALQHQPKLLVLDEPTTGLDPFMQDVFFEVVNNQVNEGATVFMSSHILSEVANVCGRVIFMKQGTIIYDEATKSIEQQAGKEVRVRADKQTLLSLVKSRPAGLGKPVAASDGSVVFLYKGTTPRLLKWLASQKIKDVDIKDRDLDSIFHNMYESKTA